jgi:hypothetical protein
MIKFSKYYQWTSWQWPIRLSLYHDSQKKQGEKGYDKRKTPLRMQGVSRGFEGGNEPLRMVNKPKTQRPPPKEVRNARN